MNFYLGVWNSPTGISNDESAARYLALLDEKSVTSEFDDQVCAFFSSVTSRYWKSKWFQMTNSMFVPGLALSTWPDDHVIMAIQFEQVPKIIGHIVGPCRSTGIGLFRPPSRQEVYLSPRLEKKPTASATRSARVSELQPAAMLVNDDFKAGRGDDAACLQAEK